MTQKNYYDILGVSKGASPEEIKKAFKNKAMEFHPDRNKEAGAEAKFKEVNEAYEVLSDTQKKQNYDNFGTADGMNGGYDFYQQGGFNGGGFGGFDFSEIFEFMSGGSGGKSRTPQPDRGKDIEYEASITLEEAFSGKNIEIDYYRMEICQVCNGSCVKNSGQSTCNICKGVGRTRTTSGFSIIERVCYGCKGTGISSDSLCNGCKGEGRLNKKNKLSIAIPSGIQNGKKIRVKNEGDAGVRGGPWGDFLLYINIQNHKIFTVDNKNLHINLSIDLKNALLGGTTTIKGIDGKNVDILIPSCLQNNGLIIVKNAGMIGINDENRGDIICHCTIQIPTKLSDEQKDLIEKAFSLSSGFKFF